MADDPAIPTQFGWDASDYDWARGPMDLGAAARDGIVFFTHKATEATGTQHVHYGEAMRRARDAGIPVLGAYHVVRSPANAAREVDYCLSYVDSQTPWWRDWPSWFWQIDLEKWPYDAVAASEGEQFADIIEARTGRKAVIYASRGQYGNELTGTSHDLWNANYGANIEDHYASVYAARGGDSGAGWVTYSGRMPVFWQYGSRTRIGTQTICDANAFRGSLAQLKALVSGGVAPTSRGVTDMLLIKVIGQDPVYVSDGHTYRHLTSNNALSAAQAKGYPIVEVSSKDDLEALAGRPHSYDAPSVDVDLGSDDLAAVEAAAAKGAEQGVINSADEIADEVVAEIAS